MDDRNDSFRLILEQIYDGVYFVDTEKRITFWNRGAEDITGHAAEDVIGRSCSDGILNHVDDAGRELCIEGCPLHASMGDGMPREAEVYLHHKNGYRVPVLIRVSPIREDSGLVIGAAEIFMENSQRIQMRTRIRRLEEEAGRDPLTGVGNRIVAERTIGARIWEFENHSVPFGILFIDIDHFKNVNDTHGHAIGDLVLTMAVKNVASGLRGGDVVCRWGGEEFVVIVQGVTAPVLGNIAERVRKAVERSWLTSRNEKVQVTVSVGGTMARAGDTVEKIVERADAEMYRCKSAGRNRTSIEGE